VSSATSVLQYILPFYFIFAVVYDIFTSTYEILYHGAPLPWERIRMPGNITPIDEHTFEDYKNMTLLHDPLSTLSPFDFVMTDYITTTVVNLINSTVS
jgi:hypothetical protein